MFYTDSTGNPLSESSVMLQIAVLWESGRVCASVPGPPGLPQAGCDVRLWGCNTDVASAIGALSQHF